MARPEKESCDFFFTSSKLLYDTKVKALRRSFKDSGNANNAFFVFDYLFREIFGNEGYHIRYTEDLVGDTADFCYLPESFVIEVIKKCADIGLFHKEQFEKNGILTSRAIQRKYAKITEKRKHSAIESRFCVLDEKLMSEETELMTTLTGLMSEESTHRKEKKEKKETVFVSTEVAEEFEKYVQSLDKPLSDYQRDLKIAELLRITNQPGEQLLVLRHTIANGWKKLVPPKEVEEAILARRLAEEQEERTENKKERDTAVTARFKESMKGETPCET